jgi:hypothetical protein
MGKIPAETDSNSLFTEDHATKRPWKYSEIYKVGHMPNFTKLQEP